MINTNLLSIISKHLPTQTIALYNWVSNDLVDGTYIQKWADPISFQALVYHHTQQKQMEGGVIISAEVITCYTFQQILVTNRTVGADYIIFNNLKYTPINQGTWSKNSDFYVSEWRLIDND